MKKFLILSALALTAVLFSSCESKEDSASSTSSSAIQGTWYLYETGTNYSLMITLTFRPDGTYTELCTEKAPFGTFSGSVSGFYTYNPLSNRLSRTDTDGDTYHHKALISGNTLTIMADDDYNGSGFEPEIYIRIADAAGGSIIGNWKLTEGSYYEETLSFDAGGKFTHYGDKTYSHMGSYGHDARTGQIFLYYTSGEKSTYFVTVANNTMVLNYIDDDAGEIESPEIFYRQ